MARTLTGINATMLLPIAITTAQDLPLPYPQAERSDVVEEIFGKPVADPYRWLEGDINTEADIAAWAEAQTALTERYLSALPGRAVFQDTLAQLYDFEQVTADKGGRMSYFYTLREGAQNFSSLRMREGADGRERVLLDPNT